jgi:hypothetical protein
VLFPENLIPSWTICSVSSHLARALTTRGLVDIAAISCSAFLISDDPERWATWIAADSVKAVGAGRGTGSPNEKPPQPSASKILAVVGSCRSNLDELGRK